MTPKHTYSPIHIVHMTIRRIQMLAFLTLAEIKISPTPSIDWLRPIRLQQISLTTIPTAELTHRGTLLAHAHLSTQAMLLQRRYRRYLSNPRDWLVLLEWHLPIPRHPTLPCFQRTLHKVESCKIQTHSDHVCGSHHENEKVDSHQ